MFSDINTVYSVKNALIIASLMYFLRNLHEFLSVASFWHISMKGFKTIHINGVKTWNMIANTRLKTIRRYNL